jgi:hypothetical protein
MDHTPTPAELARGYEGAHRASTMTNFESWTDRDLVRAVEAEPEGIGHDQAVEEYVTELANRRQQRMLDAEAAERVEGAVQGRIRTLVGEG